MPDTTIESDILDRVRASVESLNGGSPDAMLAQYAEDVVVVTPLFRFGDTGETLIRGKDAFRTYLLGFLKQYRRFNVIDVHTRENGFFVLVGLDAGEGRIGYGVTLNALGLVNTVTIYAID